MIESHRYFAKMPDILRVSPKRRTCDIIFHYVRLKVSFFPYFFVTFLNFAEAV